MKKENPFLITGYRGPEFFCNREEEVKQLAEALDNGRNMTLFSPRRMGKTGLVYHFFHHLNKNKINPVYVDIFGTETLNEFISQFANAVLRNEGKGDNFIKKALKLFAKVRPQVTFDEFSGSPQVSLQLQTDTEKHATLQDIFHYLEKQKKVSYIAIDEFQQIVNYPEKNTEQILRTYIQHLKNSRFIFSGSLRHLLLPMFMDAKRSFYQSTGFLSLKKLDEKAYASFISAHFNQNRQHISGEDVAYILEWSKRYTFYTQYLCNKLFSKRYRKITRSEINETIKEIFAEREAIYHNYKKLLPYNQYRFLEAMALEGEVREPTGQNFIKKYELGNPSTVRKSLLALLDKELVYEMYKDNKPVYEVYDVFLARWIEWK